jgi:hypothetical protein
LSQEKRVEKGRKHVGFPAYLSANGHEPMNDKHIYDLGVRVLICREEGEVCAHALELDLLGYGKTENEAISELFEAIQCQISFARSKDDDSILRFPASQEFFDRWEAAHTAALRNLVFPQKSKAFAMRATCIAINKLLTASPKARFEAMEPARA